MTKQKIRINLADQFSGCTDSKEFEVTPEQLKQVEADQMSGRVISIFDKKAQIRFDWVIEEVELLN